MDMNKNPDSDFNMDTGYHILKKKREHGHSKDTKKICKYKYKFFYY